MLTTTLLCSALVRDCSRKSHMATGDPNKTTASVHAWEDLHHSGRHWGSREAWFVDSIADEATVLDLGATEDERRACPPQWLPVLLATLKEPLPPGSPQPHLRPPSPPQPSPSPPLAPDEPCTFSRGFGFDPAFPGPDPNRCKVTLKIEARASCPLSDPAHLPPMPTFAPAARANRVRLSTCRRSALHTKTRCA